ncbi:Microtubule-nucleating Tub4p (gamma-tubulin) complex component [Coemansia brasiliensis]|uniref:Microtubule-nucleating Tub4p (Gamma-tubulin) complex component n=1 Tax=Coemansia brasiliensis TaxID=2650707 RepID=A0A9W8I719_9FUNG|nr:Microtubule-nucleating Tub4p (gamma-tubulin) complex component [Coemansia brasiliensis]
METSELDITLRKYIDSFLGAPTAEDVNELEQRDSLARYFHSIISSNIAPAIQRDENALVGEMQKRIVGSGRNVRSALQVSRLCGLLRQQNPSYNWWPILYLLLECSNASAARPSTGSRPSSYINDFQPRASAIDAEYTGGGTQPYPLPAHTGIQRLQSRNELGLESQMGTSSAIPQGMPGYMGSVNPKIGYSQALQPAEPELIPSRAVPQEEQAAVYLHRNLPTYDDISEADLLQDLIYVLQGIDGTYIRWSARASSYAVLPDIRISRPTRSMIALLSELGILTRDIQNYISDVDREGRLFEQSFCTELKVEMSEYYKLVSEIEGRLFKTPRALRPGESQMGVTLRRMYCWTTEARQKLRLMSVAITKVQEGNGGGDVLSIISTLVDDGDPFIRQFAKRLLKTTSAPFNNILISWITDGELVDPYKEFFIREREGRRDMFWTEKYTVASDMIPVHISGEMTRKIFQIGRSLNFLRVACDDAQWVAEGGPRTQLASDISDTSNLETFVYRSSSMVNERLMSVLRDKFDLMGHVEAIRRYLLLEQGDFALALMEVLDNQMELSGRTVMAHDLSAALSSAIRSSNAQYEDPDRLTVLALTFSEDSAKYRGWDEVALTYNLTAPLSYVIPRATMRQYFEVNRFLLRLKRVEHSLHTVWRQQMTESRSHLRSKELQRRKGEHQKEGKTEDSVRLAMRQSSIACSEMIQFFHQVQRYVALNVIEGAWGEFIESTRSGDIDIDQWNEAHSKYVGIIHDVVCGGSGAGFQRNLSGIFDTAAQFITVVKELYSEHALQSRKNVSVSKENRESLADRLQRIRNAGNLFNTQQQQQTPADPLAEHAGRINTIVTRFKDQVRDIVRTLSHNTTSDLQFLVVTVDFNGTYTTSG